eukprot:CAMPEP_0197925204 /NCGR_PEP_ID=MMETSP1439-20131203/96985_1 /TAXON_ID=66791 /ORGANISM="Gonyaulax spinifera, Strain CCMP409" /LENGTH=94 /DNA_ID=CAMNT_0043547671 /DNA_START=8 /DNA_END=288 /DNA_ORIENTATION=+
MMYETLRGRNFLRSAVEVDESELVAVLVPPQGYSSPKKSCSTSPRSPPTPSVASTASTVDTQTDHSTAVDVTEAACHPARAHHWRAALAHPRDA